MKICPNCQQTYTDDTLNFCLNDGTTLIHSGGTTNADDLPQTVFAPPARPTNPQANFGNQPSQFGQNQDFGNQPQGGWNNPQQPQFSMTSQTAKGSNTWIWVLGILGLGVVLCGGGLIGFFALIAKNDPPPVVYNQSNSSNNSKSSPTPKNLTKYDMSSWTTGTDEYAETKYSGGFYSIKTIKDNFYYVAITKDLKTQDKITKLTVKNVDEKPADVGYGLVIHSYTTPLIGDYVFLIDTDKKRYRIAEHLIKTEKDIVRWKDSSAIKGGSSENILEVRDNGDKMDFYINGEKITTIDDKYNNTSGVAGLYAGDGIEIRFSNLTTESK